MIKVEVDLPTAQKNGAVLIPFRASRQLQRAAARRGSPGTGGTSLARDRPSGSSWTASSRRAGSGVRRSACSGSRRLGRWPASSPRTPVRGRIGHIAYEQSGRVVVDHDRLRWSRHGASWIAGGGDLGGDHIIASAVPPAHEVPCWPGRRSRHAHGRGRPGIERGEAIPRSVRTSQRLSRRFARSIGSPTDTVPRATW